MRVSTVHLSHRDHAIIAAVARWPMTTRQLARLFGMRPKKMAEALYRLFTARLVRRTPYAPKVSRCGNVENLYFVGRSPDVRTMHHTVAVGEVAVSVIECVRSMPGCAVELVYPGDVPLRCGVLPDLTVLIRRSDGRVGCWFIEVDLGNERITSRQGYSLAGKLQTYAEYFDAGDVAADFAGTGMTGFRVALVLDPPSRLRSVQCVIGEAQHNFVLVTTLERLRDGLNERIWSTCDAVDAVDFFGRSGDQRGDRPGEQVPASPDGNVCGQSELGAAPLRDNPSRGEEHQ